MRPDPEPLYATGYIVSKGAISFAYANGPCFSNALEVKRGMAGVRLQELEILVGGLSSLCRQRLIQRPEAGLLLPALCSANESSMTRSSFPAAESASI